MMFCSKCGAQVGEDVKFCPSCGQSLGSGGSPAPTGHSVSALPVKDVFGKLFRNLAEFFSFDGRARRGEYWTNYLLLVLPLSVLCGIFYAIAYCVSGGSDTASNIAMFLFAISQVFLAASYLLLLPVVVRRLHDIGLIGWLAMAAFGAIVIPYAGSALCGAALIALGCIPGKKGLNVYGADPLEVTTSPAQEGQKAEKLAPAIWAAAISVIVIVVSVHSFDFVKLMLRKAFGGYF